MVNSVVMLVSLLRNGAIATSAEHSRAPPPDRLRDPTSPRKSGARLASSKPRLLPLSPPTQVADSECRSAPSPRPCGERGKRHARTSLLRLAGVLDGFEGLEFDVVEFAVDLL